MFDSTHGRQLARLIAVLLGVVLWSPTLGAGLGPGLGSGLSQPSQDTATCADSGERGPGELQGFEGEFSEVKEGEDSEVEDSLVGPLSCAAPPHMYECGPARATAPARERPRLTAGYDVLARERGPPVV